jgi:membrane protease subunit HflK
MTQRDPHHGPADLSGDAPLDAANQSLADALRASFRILKGIMLVLVVLYLFSNFRRIESHEQALLVRLGSLKPEVHEAGLVLAFPFPIDEIVPLPTRKSNELSIDSHTFRRTRDEIGKPLAFISRGPAEGLRPTLDGALMTADAGLVHMRWRVTYKFDGDDVVKYVSNISGREVEAAEDLIRILVENAGIHVASEMTAEEMIRTRVSDVHAEMKRRLNESLESLNSGITITLIEMQEPTPPIQVRRAFDETIRAENYKEKRISDAKQQSSKILNEVAGAAHEDLLKKLAVVDDADAEPGVRAAAEAEVDRLLHEKAEGEAGRMIKDASAYLSLVVSQIQSDVSLYETLLPEYKRNPSLLIARILEQTKQRIMNYDGVVKIFRPDMTEVRLLVPIDPEQSRITEEKRLQEREFDVSKLRPQRYAPIGPEFE